MSILVGLRHVTRYDYDRPVSLGPQVVRLRPAPHCRTRVASYSLSVTPTQHFVNWQQDPHGNFLARFVFPEPTREFSITVDLLADLEVINPFDFFVEPYAETWPFAFPAELREDLSAFVAPEPAGPRLTDLLRSISRKKRNTIDFLVELNQRLQQMIRYLIRMEAGVLTPEETLAAGAGSCRDTAWLLVQILRHLGLPARFVSGYLIQLRPDVKPLEGAAGAERDFTDLHAWAEVYLPGAGWIGLDATSGLLCGEGHLPVAATPHFRSAAPITGLVEPSGVRFSFDMKVERIDEKPRVTAPFSDAAWRALDALGEKVDADLNAADVRLTMGGEPTFVSVDDYQSAEWTTAALGATKRARADELIRRLRDRFAPGGLMHHGQGKWYPGEPIPRWAFSLYWRRDGVPIWRNDGLIAREAAALDPLPDDAQRFAEGIAARIGITADYVQPAYEDPADRMLQQGLIPENVDPSDPKIDDPVERERILKLFDG
ncbi:MAG TPA: transglutaminase family protein, partial [Xanthobacteraceae bacterium]|nr:transglutaminase family protein [Xanthobacteraceae bacterium]